MIVRILVLLLCAVLAIATPAAAQDIDPILTATRALDHDGSEYDAVNAAFDTHTDPADAKDLQDRVDAVKEDSDSQVDALTTQLQLIDARIAQLGPVTPGIAETPDIQAQRKLFARQRSVVDSAIKRGKLLSTEADQLSDEIGHARNEAFSEHMSVQVASPLTPAFWGPFFRSLPRDGHRLSAFMMAESRAIQSGMRQGGLPAVLLGLVAAVVLIWPVRVGLRMAGRRYVIERVPGNRLRRSGLALWLTVVGTAVPGLAAWALIGGARAGGVIAPQWDKLADNFVLSCFIAALIAALGGALLQRRQPSWRIIAISDETANTLRPWTFAVSAVTVASVLLIAIRSGVGASGPAEATTEVIAATLYIVLVFAILIVGARLRAAATKPDVEDKSDRSVIAFLSLATWAVLAVATVALAIGYVAFGYFLARFTVWIAVVAASLYLLLISVDDICTTMFRRDGRVADVFQQSFGVRRSLVDQFGVALSGLLRMLLILIAAGMVLFPFGSDVPTLFGQIGRIAQGITVGEVTISPWAILRAFAVLAVGLTVTRGVQKWLVTRYLPATELDAGAQNSISMVARYAGLMLAVLWALASLGIGLERIALLLSALSVGIGFGLQAITQNFVSGLILLAERPVKIGDWVRIGDQEGDVKRISVRATEIQIADRSTLIVPNSELITKSVINKTLSDPIGRIQLQFSVPIGSDIPQVRQIVMAIYKAQVAILDDPAAVLFIDSVLDGRINFNSFAYVNSPRAVYPTRSEVWFELLSQLPAAGIELGTTPQQVQWIGNTPGHAEATGAAGVVGMPPANEAPPPR